MLRPFILRWCSSLLVALLIRLADSQVGDVTPPILTIDNVHPFIFHFLVTVSINEDGEIWCAALLNTGLGTVAPSAVQIKGNLAPLAGRGYSAVTGNQRINLAVIGLFPGTVYDLYCYAEDARFNQMQPAAISGTKREGLATASGGDYIRPIFSYVAPFTVVESVTIKLYTKLNEQGTVWCVVRKDTGSGTLEPSSGEIIGNTNNAAWGTGTILAQNMYIAEIRLQQLDEASTYDAYCFAKDVAGNGIDNTPAWTRDTTSITATKVSGITTDSTMIAASFLLRGESGDVAFPVEPATWNRRLPNQVISGNQVRRGAELESCNTKLFNEAWLMNHAEHHSRGCTHLPVAPDGFVWMAVVRRGGCSLLEKSRRAFLSGYAGLVVIDHQSGPLPDMTADKKDIEAKVPAWILSTANGNSLAAAVSAAAAPLSAYLKDLKPKPRLGMWQSDSFGARLYVTH